MYYIFSEILLGGHPDEKPPPFERPHNDLIQNMKVLISSHDERPTLLNGHISCAKGVVSQERFHC